MPSTCTTDPVHGKAISTDRRVVRESPRDVPVRNEVDVLVVGGGPAGVGAALAAASAGARTLIVERAGCLGGMWTTGYVNPFFEYHHKGWIVRELVDRLDAAGAWRHLDWLHISLFDIETMARTLDGMAAEAGVEVWFNVHLSDAIVQGDAIRGIILESKAGREAVLARAVIDCTGDGDVAARAGAAYEMGRDANGLAQSDTLMFEIEG